MWLIDVKTHILKFFHNEKEVPYAILSHRWGEDEVFYSDIQQEWRMPFSRKRKGWDKITKCCERAQKDNIAYVWIDTCCIDKSSSAELQEAINSMFRWYRQASVCYAFLADVDEDYFKPLSKSEWFKRGWTLQELLAPKNLAFFDAKWRQLGTRLSLAAAINELTGIKTEILANRLQEMPCVAEIMSWAAGRRTTRPEDRAYSLLGLLGISMPLLYGEGNMAFIRLQEEILRRSDDQSIFAWSGPKHVVRGEFPPGLLATSPDQFSYLPSSHNYLPPATFPRRAAHSITNEGISVQLLLIPIKPRIYLAILNPIIIEGVTQYADIPNYSTPQSHVYIILKRIDADRYARWGDEVNLRHLDIQCVRPFNIPSISQSSMRQVVVVNSLKQHEKSSLLVGHNLALRVVTETDQSNDRGIEVCPQEPPGTVTNFDVDEIKRGLAYFIWLKPFGTDDIIPKIRIPSIAFKFDFDLNPVCMFSIEWPGQGSSVNSSRDALGDSEFSSNSFPNNTELSLHIEGGQWRKEARELVAVRPTLDNIFSGGVCSVKARSRYVGSPGGTIEVEMLEDIEAGYWDVKVTTRVWGRTDLDLECSDLQSRNSSRRSRHRSFKLAYSDGKQDAYL